MKTIQVSVRFPKMLIDELDHNVDGVKIRSRTQAITIAVQEFLDRLATESKGGQMSMLKLKPPRKSKQEK